MSHEKLLSVHHQTQVVIIRRKMKTGNCVQKQNVPCLQFLMGLVLGHVTTYLSL